MAVSKNNPAVRSGQTLLVFCPKCNSDMKLVKTITGGSSKMNYKCQGKSCDERYPVFKGSYKDLPHQWIGKGKK